MGLKVYKTFDTDNTLLGYSFHCPACGYGHMYHTEKPNECGAKWTFNGNLEKPTFRASMLVNAKNEGREPKCHLFVTDGKIQYLGDCTHKMAGQTIEMEDIK